MSLLLLLACLATSRLSVFADAAAAAAVSPPPHRRSPPPAALAPAITQVPLPSPPSPVMDPVRTCVDHNVCLIIHISCHYIYR